MHLWLQLQNLGDLNHQTQSIWTTALAAPPTAKTPDLGLAFFFALFLSFSTTEKNFDFRKACSLCDAWRHTSEPVRTAFASCQHAPTQSDEVNIKTDNDTQAWCVTCRLKGPQAFLSSFCICYKNNFITAYNKILNNYKCLHSTNFTSKAASLLSHPNKSVNKHAQAAFLIYSCNSKSPRTVSEIFFPGNDPAIIQTTNYNALDEKFPLHATVIKD